MTPTRHPRRTTASGRAGARCAGTLFAALLMAAAAAQDEPHFPRSLDPMGVVLDENGKPVEGASVRLVWTTPRFGTGHFGRAIAAVLRAQPFFALHTARDGTFVLPLTRDQRHLPFQNDQLALVVTKEGHRTWAEAIPSLHAYLGSRVVLPRLRPEDALVLRVRRPAPGMRLLLERSPGPLRWIADVPVPESGEVRLAEGGVPQPGMLPSFTQLQTLSLDAHLLAAGPAPDSTPLLPLPVEQPVPPTDKAADPGDTEVTVRGPDGAPPRALRSLRRGPDGVLRWFAEPAAKVARQPRNELVALVAAGTLAAYLPGTEVEVRAVGKGPAALRVVDDRGRALAGARAELHPLERLPAPNEAVLHPPLRTWVADAEGRIACADAFPAEPCFLRVVHPGNGERLVPEPRALADDAPIALAQSATAPLSLCVLGGDGAPLAGASVFLSDEASAGDSCAERLVTDDKGYLRLAAVNVGACTVVVRADGHRQGRSTLRIAHGTDNATSIQLEAAVDVAAWLRDEAGGTVPFGTLYVQALQGWQTADSEGRLWLRDVPRGRPLVAHTQRGQVQLAESEEVQALTTAGGGWFVLISGEEVGVQSLARIWSRGSSSTGFGGAGQRGRAFLVRCEGPFDGTVFVRGTNGFAVAVPMAEIEAGLRSGVAPRIDRSRIVRRVPVEIRGAGDRSEGFAAVPLLDRNWNALLTSIYSGPTPLERGQDGRFYLPLRDRRAWFVEIQHPEFKPARLEVPEAPKEGEPEVPVTVEVEGGTQVVLELKVAGAPRVGWWNLSVNRANRGTILQQNTQEPPPFEKRGDQHVVRIRMPYALEPGEYQVQWNFQSAGNGNRTFRVDGPGTLVVQLRPEAEDQAGPAPADQTAPARVPASRPAGKR